MAIEHKKRRVVFQESTIETPVQIDPPFKSSQLDLEDEFVEKEINAETDVEAITDGYTSEPETEVASDGQTNGWNLLTDEQKNGATYFVTADVASEGTRAFWRRTRVLSHNKWVMHGKWSDTLTRADVIPEPRYYKRVV